MQIYAHTMVKNEAKWLWYSVTSVINYVDKILLWDTGSTDGTLEICRELVKRYGNKISFKQIKQESITDFPIARQEMLDETKSDWFLMLDGDEIWWKDSIKKVIEKINNDGKNIESIYVPTVNAVGDIFHFQDDSSGRYRFGDRVGHYNLRAVNMNIPGLHSEGVHGVWGWVDNEHRMIQDRGRDKVSFVNAPYLHTTFLQRASTLSLNKSVVKRAQKLKYEIGKDFPLDFFYPEVFFEDRPDSIGSPWQVMDTGFKIRSYIETPLRKLKRRWWVGRAGY